MPGPTDPEAAETSPAGHAVGELLGALVDRASDSARAQRTLELLLEANRAILSQLSLRSVLHQIARYARELVHARYAALGVIGSDGALSEFVHVGMDSETVQQVGDLPKGLGLLGVLIEEPSPLRLERIAADPRSSGFPPHHPAMETFLGVPIVVRGVVYGNLYLTERVGGEPFTADDEAVIHALAVSAGLAIENARLYEESQRRQGWAQASAEVGSALLDPEGGAAALGLIADTVLRLTGGDVLSLVVPDSDETFRVLLARGEKAGDLDGLVYPASRSVAGVALETGRGVRIDTTEDERGLEIHLRQVVDVGPVLGLPLHGSSGSHGVLVVARRRGRARFATSDLELGESFAAQAAIAIELAEARADQQRLLVLEDRERIARDLHDHVIQRLFASGLTLESLAGSLAPSVAGRVVGVVDDLDVTIRQIRTLIFRLQASEPQHTTRSVVLQVAAEAAPVLGFEPDVDFDGPVDTAVGAGLVDEVVAVCREALSNVARHAHASQVALSVSATPNELSLVVSDDGVGLGPSTRRSGLDNLERRALHHGGRCELGASPSGGTELRWSVPLT